MSLLLLEKVKTTNQWIRIQSQMLASVQRLVDKSYELILVQPESIFLLLYQQIKNILHWNATYIYRLIVCDTLKTN